ncbi:MAG: hypothetical protein A3E87_01570 [Gammaproteobacteria bacterium RIFCSPHIGHO2_12_FULL_35_23]|nr:MAG: hypothetical protein A3E87_01570 [Gammaproteobacteria bacterium RIFCSPHIGHO2_12_FULL_35_23]
MTYFQLLSLMPDTIMIIMFGILIGFVYKRMNELVSKSEMDSKLENIEDKIDRLTKTLDAITRVTVIDP